MKTTWPTMARVVALLTLPAIAVPASARGPRPPPSASQETTLNDSTFTIRAERNLVVVRVVARDPDGKAVTGLRKEDFRLFDNGKLQSISTFSVEAAETNATPGTERSAVQTPPSPATETEQRVVIPDRFVALFFDDVHIAFDDLVRTRDAANRYISTNLRPADRVGLFTASGVTFVDFTADRQKLRDALLGLRQQPMGMMVGSQNAQQGAGNVGAMTPETVGQLTLASRVSLLSLQKLCRRMATMPGQRTIVLLSPGFTTWSPFGLGAGALNSTPSAASGGALDAVVRAVNLSYEVDQEIDSALRAGVVINTFDVRGLYADLPWGDASQQTPEAPSSPGESTFEWQTQQQMLMQQIPVTHAISMLEQTIVLASLAAGTGGVYFHNSNDYDAGFRRTGGLPETAYVLTFSPQNLKSDGSFHKLKVTLAPTAAQVANPSKLTLQARHGYYAPGKSEDAAARAHDRLEEAAFSGTEISGLPLEVHTRFFKTDNLNAKLTVLAHVDAQSVQFLKQGDRSLGNLVLVAVLFDSDGNFLKGAQTTLDMRLLDRTRTIVQQTGIVLRADLDAKVGTYLIRAVVRDSESGSMSAVSTAIEIPY